jgi:hypothetical protein
LLPKERQDEMRRLEAKNGPLYGSLALKAGVVQQRTRFGTIQSAKADAVIPTKGTSRPLRRMRERRKMLALSIGILTTLGFLAALVVSPRQLVSLIASSSNQSAAINADSERVGKIVVQPGSNDCKQKKFDNQSGRISEHTSPCDDRIVLDVHGVPVPVGTIHRLDAIRKSFSAH